jgi:quercetin dioxygenase-like cupin family protein
MRTILAGMVVSSLVLASGGQAQEAKAPTHVLLAESQLTWGEGPPSLPKGGMTALLSGDPGKPGSEYTLRAKLPAGYKIPPHWHPSDEHVTVLSGTVAFGMGEKAVVAEMKDLPAGGYAVMPANMRHYFAVKTAAVIQVHGTGPFVINYINPADDPRGAAPSK